MKSRALIGTLIFAVVFVLSGEASGQLSVRLGTTPRTFETQTPSLAVEFRDTPTVLTPGFEHLFTPPLLEPNGFTAVCFATNIDRVERILGAQIVDAAGNNVSESSTCGGAHGPGATCHSTARFQNNATLRCVVSTSGPAATLRGSMMTSSGPFPFTLPANLVVTAE